MPCGEILQLSNRLTPCPTSSAARDWTPSGRSGLQGRTRRTRLGNLGVQAILLRVLVQAVPECPLPLGFPLCSDSGRSGRPGMVDRSLHFDFAHLSFLCLFCRLIHFFCLFFTWITTCRKIHLCVSSSLAMPYTQ